MVLKVSKGGVQSGNTLRGFRTHKIRWYNRHAVLIGRSSMPARELNTLLQSSSDDTWVTDTLNSPNVLLSLNKKQRWRLPATFGHMIQTGCFNSKTTVSLLERHKLKRGANCVRFFSNKGKVKEVTPSDKRYFSFNLDNIDSENSKRELRRQRVKCASRMKKPKEKEKNDYVFNNRSTIVYTMAGPEEKEKTVLKTITPEYRMEVFYPCPKSCSLTYNPKYTNVALEEGENGIQEVKRDSVAAVKKSKPRHRKHLINARWGLIETEEICDDVNQMWNEVYQDKYNDTSMDSTSCEEVKYGDKMCARPFHEDVSLHSWEKPAPENFLIDLISLAGQTKMMCFRKPIIQDNKVLSTSEGPQGISLEKSHIVFEEGSESKLVREKHTIPKEDRVLYTDLNFSRVILTSEETSAEHLRSKYGELYSEAASEPRRFTINVSDDVKRILNPTLRENDRLAYLSYLVFCLDGVYDNKCDTFRVCLNSYRCKNTEPICQTLADVKHCSIDDLINHLSCVLLDMQTDGDLTLDPRYVLEQNCITTSGNVYQQNLCSVETFRPSEEIARIAFSDRMQQLEGPPTKLHRLVNSTNEYLLCGICYGDVNREQVNRTELSRCGHQFCDDCWRSHVRTRFRNGSIGTVCPGYDCDATVGPVTLLSLVHITELGQLLQRSCEDQVETSTNSKWCPAPRCGRVIKVDVYNRAPNLSYDVTCDCGVQMCFSCLGPAHWPAKCEQAENYMEKLSSLKPFTEHFDECNTALIPQQPKRKKVHGIIIINGCKCPYCGRFIEKNGGSSQMICKCGHEFCWECLLPYFDLLHQKNGCRAKPYTRSYYDRGMCVAVCHIERQPLSNNMLTKTKKGAKQKASMYQRALQQRQEKDNKTLARAGTMLAINISTAASKDLVFKRELLSHCGLEEIPFDEPSLAALPGLPHVTKLIRSCRKIKQALHHVTEYTFVLLRHVPNSVEKQRVLRLANDMSGYCSFLRSILEAGDQQDAKAAVRRLTDIQLWAQRGLVALLTSAEKLRC